MPCAPAPHRPPHRTIPPRPWAPLSDAAWTALLPHVLPRAPQGRRVSDLRRRMDGVFWIAASRGAPWRDLPERFGKPDTVARFFRRLTHNGLWHRLLAELAHADADHPIQHLAHAICRAARRAARIGGLALIVLIRRLGLHTALNGPPWLLPDPVLSETLAGYPIPRPDLARHGHKGAAWSLLRSLRRLWRDAAGRARIPPAVRWAWA